MHIRSAARASIGHRLRLDPKVTADQPIDVATEEHTKTSVTDLAIAARKLEEEVLERPKIVRVPRWNAS